MTGTGIFKYSKVRLTDLKNNEKQSLLLHRHRKYKQIQHLVILFSRKHFLSEGKTFKAGENKYYLVV